jgi:hypothetical protein
MSGGLYPTITWPWRSGQDPDDKDEIHVLAEDRGDGDQFTLCGGKREQCIVCFDRVPTCRECIREVYALRLKLMAGGLP